MEKVLSLFFSRSDMPKTQVMLSIKNLKVIDNSQILIELTGNKIQKILLDDSLKTVYTDDLEYLQVNIYKSDRSKIGFKSLELMKKIYYYDIYTLISSKSIEFHTKVDLAECKFQIQTKLILSSQMKEKLKKQRLTHSYPTTTCFSCLQICENRSEIQTNS